MTKKPNTAAAVVAAEKELVTARERLAAASSRLKTKRADVANAIMAWQGMFPPRDFETVYRDHLARQRARELAIINGETPIEEGPPEIIPSHMDAVLRSGKKGGSVNFGYRRPAAGLRGPKAPSQR